MQERRDSLQAGEFGAGGPGWSAAAALMLLAVCWAALAWPWLSGRVTIPWDAKATFLPQVQFLARSLANGEWPFWTPDVFSGHPQIADPQSLIFSPPHFILALLDARPGPYAGDLALLAMVLAGAAAMLVHCRDRGWHWAAALVAALGFGFGAAMAWRIQHVGQVLSLVYLAIAWLLVSRALERGSILYGVAAGVAAGLMVLGRDQIALLGAYLLTAWVLAWFLDTPRDGRGKRIATSILPLAGGVVAGLLVIAVPIALTLLVAADSNRPAIDLEGAGRGSLHPALLATFLVPDLYGSAGHMRDFWGPPSFHWADTGLHTAQNVGVLYIGALPALLIVGGLLGGHLWQRDIRFVSIATAALVAYALGWYTPIFAAAHAWLPGIDLYRRPADAVFPIGMLLALLAGFVTHKLLAGDIGLTRERLTGLVLVVAFLAAIGLAAANGRLDQALTPLAYSAATFALSTLALGLALWLLPIRPILAGLLPVAVLTADLAWHNGPNTSTALAPAAYDVLRPDTANETIALLKQRTMASQSATRRDRIELAGLGFHWPNASLTHGLENTLGYNPVRLGHYSEATGAQDHVGLPDQRRFSALFPSYRSRMADLLGLRFIATGVPIEQMDPLLQPGDLNLVQRTPDGYVYENPNALPRVMFATAARTADFAALLAGGQWPEVDPTQTVLVENAPADAAPRPAGTVRILSYANTEIVILADSQAGGYVVLNDIWQPWWFVQVDGAPAELLRANVIFRAVAVPAGRHIVRFDFRPLAGAFATWREALRSPSEPVAAHASRPAIPAPAQQ